MDRFLDYADVLRAPAPVGLIVYTPDEFTRQRRHGRFVWHVLRESHRVV